MPDPRNDRDQHRFAQIVGRMLDGVAKNAPEYFIESSGVKTRDEFRHKLTESTMVQTIVECCAYEAQLIEEERSNQIGKRSRRPQ